MAWKEENERGFYNIVFFFIASFILAFIFIIFFFFYNKIYTVKKQITPIICDKLPHLGTSFSSYAYCAVYIIQKTTIFYFI